MGYYTAYGLDIKGDYDKVEAFEKALLKESNNDCCVEELIKCGGTYAKLYDIEDWITAVAASHPDVLVILTGDGEESDDRWEERWKGLDNETQHAVIPPFSHLSLLTPDEISNRTINL